MYWRNFHDTRVCFSHWHSPRLFGRAGKRHCGGAPRARPLFDNYSDRSCPRSRLSFLHRTWQIQRRQIVGKLQGTAIYSPPGRSGDRPSLFSLITSAGKSACLISSVTFGRSSCLIEFHFFNCSSSRPLNDANTSICGLVGSRSPASTEWLKVSNASLSMFGNARFPSEPFMFT